LRNPKEIVERHGMDSIKTLYGEDKWMDLIDLVIAYIIYNL
jgi:hypothetical protein